MRVISQKGIWYLDFPYDKVLVFISKKESNTIKVQPLGEPDSDYVMARYSTQKKAKKVMEMLREEYQAYTTLKNATVAKILEITYKEEMCAAIFQFPEDEEVDENE